MLALRPLSAALGTPEAHLDRDGEVEMTTEGMRRLGVVLGVLASVAWVISIAVISGGFARVQPIGWVIFVVGVPVSFGAAFLVIWGVDWVIAGFRRGAKH